MKAYLDLGKRLIEEGEWVENKRTGVKCLTVINADLTFDVENNKFPLVTTRKSFYKQAIMELIGYLRGFETVEQFKSLGVNTWDANANENEDWLKNPHRKGEGDLGRVYGVQANDWTNQFGEKFNLVNKVYDNLRNRIDDRGEIITFWNPGEFDYGCLRPCMHSHQFSILNDKLYLNSTQRSQDFLLGGVFNMVQCFTLLKLMAQITGLNPGKAYLKIVNLHIYENQLELFKEIQLKRIPFDSPQLHINPDIKTLKDLNWVTGKDFTISGYQHHDAIKYPFTV